MSTGLVWDILKFQKSKILIIGFQLFKNNAFKNPQVGYITRRCHYRGKNVVEKC